MKTKVVPENYCYEYYFINGHLCGLEKCWFASCVRLNWDRTYTTYGMGETPLIPMGNSKECYVKALTIS